MVIWPYSNVWEKEPDYFEVLDKNEAYFMSRIIQNLGGDISASELTTIEIETFNRCNNDCSFCPASRQNDKRTPRLMEEKTFIKIIDELAKLNYSGWLSLFSNDEPLLDKRIVRFLNYARNKLPQAKHALYTNGLLLDLDLYQALVENLDYLVIDNYNDELELYPNIEEIRTKKIRTECKVIVMLRRKNQVLSTRGGIAPNKNTIGNYTSVCVLPFTQMVVRPDGKVSRCCQDVYGEETLGDLAADTVDEVWNGTEYRSFRQTMMKRGRTPSHCRLCDMFGFINYTPLSWIREYDNVFWDLLEKTNKNVVVIGNWQLRGKFFERKEVNFKFSFCDSLDKLGECVEDCFIVLAAENTRDINFLIQKGKHVIEDFVIYNNIQYVFEPEQYSKDMKKLYKASDEGKLVLFGTGWNAGQIVDAYDLSYCEIVDNNVNKQGELYHGQSVKSLEEIDIHNKIFLLSMADSSSVERQLCGYGVQEEQIVRGVSIC